MWCEHVLISSRNILTSHVYVEPKRLSTPSLTTHIRLSLQTLSRVLNDKGNGNGLLVCRTKQSDPKPHVNLVSDRRIFTCT